MLCQFNPASPGAIDEIKSATGGGVEFTFEMAGSVRALDLAYRITRRGGTNGDGRAAAARPHVCAAPVNLVAEERTVKGSYIGTCVLTRDLPRYIELYRRGRLRLDEINLGFDRGGSE